MLVIHYTQVSTRLVQEVAWAPTNWIGMVNIPPEAPAHPGRGSKQGSGERRLMFCQHMQWTPSICVMEPHSSNNTPTPLRCPEKPVVVKIPAGGHQEKKFPVQYFVCSMFVYLWPMFADMSRHVLVPVLHKHTHANSALWWPCEYRRV